MTGTGRAAVALLLALLAASAVAAAVAVPAAVAAPAGAGAPVDGPDGAPIRGPNAAAGASPFAAGAETPNPAAGGTSSVATQDGNPCVGTITERPENTTLLSIQGARAGEKTDALLVGYRPDGSVVGVHSATGHGRWWAYDVDPLANGNLLFSTTEPGISVVEEVDPDTGEHVSVRRFPDVLDSHDADLINGDELVLNDMSQDGDARLVVYNLTREAVVWEYRFAAHPEHFPRAGGGEFDEDWTHNNDVEQIEPGVFMVSVRNFDQVVAINRTTKEIEWRLGRDGDHEIMYEQHNPDYLEGADGTPTVLIADSLNDRVVEYARVDGEWERTWVLRGGGLNEPRDADRLPNGNTLVVDRRGHRLLEVTPRGEVVWEVYAPWQPYDAERVGTGDESAGPTTRELGATGTYRMTGSQGVDGAQAEACYAYLTAAERGDRLVPAGESLRAGRTVTGVDDPDGTGDGDGTDGDSALGTPPGPLSNPAVIAVVVLLVVAALGLVWWLRE